MKWIQFFVKLLRNSATAVSRVVYHSDPFEYHSKSSKESLKDISEITTTRDNQNTSITNAKRKYLSYPSDYELLCKKGIFIKT